MAAPGHNGQLKAFVERIERVEEEEKNLRTDKKEIYAEAKSAGHDPKILRKVIARRKADKNKLAEQEAMIEAYMNALGDFAKMPLGKAAVDRVSAKG